MARASKALYTERSAKPLAILLFVGLLLMVTLFHRPTELSTMSKTRTSLARQLLSRPPLTDQSTTEFHPQQPKNSGNRQFQAAAHEVPSGPNPESNK
ncbi:hypothetical protein CJ030_MR5G016195 [Morella rubra]|uniref:CLAVATA3/ESR (CLE)-related protein 44 n=1 Tax=Morella rubra TaxID=262757 RepID=A0A6A1VSQ6_9ROSI|nr:hypothetical protein CJ030_MR5G016195 [Morella rubra]